MKNTAAFDRDLVIFDQMLFNIDRILSCVLLLS